MTLWGFLMQITRVTVRTFQNKEHAELFINFAQSSNEKLKEQVKDNKIEVQALLVPEILELKKDIFSQLDQLAPPNAVLGTNTSGLLTTPLPKVTYTSTMSRYQHLYLINGLRNHINESSSKVTMLKMKRCMHQRSWRISYPRPGVARSQPMSWIES